MSRVSTVDATGALVLKDAIGKLHRRGITVMASGVRPGRLRTLDSLGVLDSLRSDGRVYDGTPDAIRAARTHLHRAGVPPLPLPRRAVTSERAAPDRTAG
jgi:SulP family sulfate permease